MRAGYGQADITPKEKINLCGFVARCNEFFEEIDDNLSVKAFTVEEGGSIVLLLSFDLLGLGEDITELIHQSLDDIEDFNILRKNRIYCCTHTHSAPAVIKLTGCGTINKDYVEQVVSASKAAALEALGNLRKAYLRVAKLNISGANYNRRRVLEDRRVVMTLNPDAKICSVGSTWDDFLFLRFEDDTGKPVAGFVNWAAHACTVCGNNVSGDHPAEFCRQLSKRFSMPFIFLQGACGDLNPPFEKMTRQEMLDNVSFIMKSIDEIPWGEPVETNPFTVVSKALKLQYGTLPVLSEIEKVRDGNLNYAQQGI